MIDLRDWFEIGGFAATVLMSWAVASTKVDDHARQLRELWQFKDRHEKESATYREQIANRFGAVEARAASRDVQIDEMRKLLEKMDQKIDRLIEGRDL